MIGIKMGWGGKRDNSGRKSADEETLGQKAVSLVRSGARKISEIAVSAITSQRPERAREIKPFEVDPKRFHPPSVGGPSAAKLAMDNAMVTTNNWAAGAWANNALGSMFWEGQEFLGYPYLAVLAQRPEYRAIVETVATESMRKGFKVQAIDDIEDDASEGADPDKSKEDRQKDDQQATERVNKNRVKEVTDYLNDMRVKDRLKLISAQDGYFGRAHLYVDTGDSDSRDELLQPIGDGRDETTRAKIVQGMRIQLRTVEAVWCNPNAYNSNNPLKADWYNPQTWFALGMEIHRTRLLPFVGNPLPDLLKPAYSFGGLSMTQMAKPYVDNWLQTRQSVNDIIQAFSVMVLKTDMQASLQTNGQELIKRALLFNAFRKNNGLFMLNKETEEFDNIAVPLGTLDALQAQAQEHLCSISRIPTVKLLGIQPAGLNADSEGIMRAFYDNIGAYQEAFYRPHLTTIFEFAQMALWGEVDKGLTFVFEPLYTLDEKGKAEVDKIKAETGVILVDGGVLHPEEERERLAADPSSPYQNLEAADVPEPPDMGMEGENGDQPEEGGGTMERTKIKSSINVAGGDGAVDSD